MWLMVRLDEACAVCALLTAASLAQHVLGLVLSGVLLSKAAGEAQSSSVALENVTRAQRSCSA
jgi:hypothetical protein